MKQRDRKSIAGITSVLIVAVIILMAVISSYICLHGHHNHFMRNERHEKCETCTSIDAVQNEIRSSFIVLLLLFLILSSVPKVRNNSIQLPLLFNPKSLFHQNIQFNN